MPVSSESSRAIYDALKDGGIRLLSALPETWLVHLIRMADDDPEMTLVRLAKEGKRYRMRMRNASDDIHPIHLHRHSFELTRVAGQPTSGVMKDLVMVGGYQEVEVDFVANNPGLTLFHCHQQLHMDFGFMALVEYI